MIQLIGFIVAAYAIIRVIQVPLEMSGSSDDPAYRMRFVLVSLVSAAGFVVLVGLAVFLGMYGSRMTLPPLPPMK